MNNLTRLAAAVVFAALAACGNKGPLMRPAKVSSDIPAPASPPPGSDPTIALPAQEPSPIGTDGSATPPASEPTPPAPVPDGGNG